MTILQHDLITPSSRSAHWRRGLASFLLVALLFASGASGSSGAAADRVVRVFIFAGQSNMVGADSSATEIERFPPFVGLDQPQEDVLFAYSIGRENKRTSDGWTTLQPVNGLVGPELSFARKVASNIDAPVAIIKCAAGGTHLGGDWNPDEPSGFEMYSRTLDLIRSALADLERRKIPYRLEGFMWHQGENDMFDAAYMSSYGANLKNLLTSWRRDLETPDLRFYIGELCTKTIWGMDLRPRMYAISLGQREVTESDPLADFVPTSHVGVKIGGGVGLHYHYGTLGQLEHGVNYADAYLRSIDKGQRVVRPLKKWPYKEGSKVKLFVLIGHRNMEGERAFVQQLKRGSRLRKDNSKVAYRYNLGDGYRLSDGWEPLGPAGYYDTFGPELSFGDRMQRRLRENVAIGKFTHSGSQIIDWTPEGSDARSRTIYPRFIAFVRETIEELEERGHEVELAGVFYHVGENDMSFGPFRKRAAEHIAALVAGSREDLSMPALEWFVSQQAPTDDESVNSIDVTGDLEKMAAADGHLTLVQVFDLPGEDSKLVIGAAGIVALGVRLADAYLEVR